MIVRILCRISAFSCVLVLGACLGVQPPAPVVHYGRDAGAGSAGIHTVSRGENLYLISSRYRLPIQDIVTFNEIRPPFALSAGQRLRLPPPRTYTARRGDSLYEISRLFGTDTREIARLNDLDAPYRLEPGQTLRLPAPSASVPARLVYRQSTFTRSASLARTAPPTVAGTPAPGTSPLERWRSLLEGARLQTSPSAQLSSVPLLSPPPEKPSPRSAESILGISLEDLFAGRKPITPASLSSATAGRAGTGRTSASAPSALSDPPPRAGGAFAWPVRGRLVSAYGPKQGGLHNDGINIAAPRGTPVKAAENGVVVYSGNGLSGYGNLVLIRHKDRWVTAYGHLDKVHVRKGDLLRRGHTIGTTGSTGSVDTPQLHFEIRRGTKAINPKPLLG